MWVGIRCNLDEIYRKTNKKGCVPKRFGQDLKVKSATNPSGRRLSPVTVA